MRQKLTFERLRGSLITCVASFLTMVSMAECCIGQTGTLAEPFPAPAANGALHYQRALLHLARLDSTQIQPLDKPVWEVLPEVAEKEMPRDVTRLLYRARFAVRSAAAGTRSVDCNFGIDFSHYGAATQLPHLEGMVQLGRLLTLRGAHAESRGEWEEAAIVYFDGLRMGRHLTHQSTLLEALAGIEILRNNYFALARWSTRCPSRPLVARAFGLLESIQPTLVEPSQVLARETSILSLEFNRLRDAYPDGNWAAMVLESFGQEATGNNSEDANKAIAACVKRGVPKDVFSSPTTFHEYVNKLRTTGHRFAESVTACMTLPPQPRLRRAHALNDKYSNLIKVLAADTLIDPVEIGALLAEHEAELTVARLALAVSASKKDGKFPASLQDVADRFGGDVPGNPYSHEAVAYQQFDKGRSFGLTIPSLGALPEVDFNSLPPAALE